VGRADSSAIAVDLHGDEVVTWVNTENDASVYARIRSAGQGFSRPVRLGLAASTLFGPVGPILVYGARDPTVLWAGVKTAESQTDDLAATALRRQGARVIRRTTILSRARDLIMPVEIGVDAAGRTSAFWDVGAVQRVATRSPGAAWSGAETIPNPRREGPANPVYAVAANGDSVALWGSDDGIFAAIRRGDGRFGPAKLIGQPTSSSYPYAIGGGQVAMDVLGDAIAVWSQCPQLGCAGVSVLAYAIRRRGAASFSTAHTLARDSTGIFAVAMDSRGDATVAWAMTRPPLPPRLSASVVAAVRPAGGHFGSARVLSPLPGGDLAACYDQRGHAYVVWAYASPTDSADYRILGADLPPSSREGELTQTIWASTRDPETSGPELACGARGASTVWTAGTGPDAPVYEASARP
jgi:hypothetical protein